MKIVGEKMTLERKEELSILLKTKGGWVLGESQCEEEKSG